LHIIAQVKRTMDLFQSDTDVTVDISMS
jgi:hypothetical protein